MQNRKECKHASCPSPTSNNHKNTCKHFNTGRKWFKDFLTKFKIVPESFLYKQAVHEKSHNFDNKYKISVQNAK